MRGEGKGYVEGLCESDNVEVKPVFFSKLRTPIGGLDETVEQDIEGRFREPVEVNVIIVFAGVGVAANQFANTLAKGLN